ncbi:hypothetical protein WN944_001417 [Citrus x changshan-huyou]|uniref:Uncharacterized protein n=1 Tax=Citrus x changshan-huyou TaxID=2935761 RepID=A0AAP0MEM2_9ROSI
MLDAKVSMYAFSWGSYAEIPNFDAHELGILREHDITLQTCGDVHNLKRCKNNILIQVIHGYGKPLVSDFPPRKMKTAPMMKFFINRAIPMSYYPNDTLWQVNKYIVNAAVVFELLRGEGEKEDSEEEEESSSKKPKLVQYKSNEPDKGSEERGE